MYVYTYVDLHGLLVEDLVAPLLAPFGVPERAGGRPREVRVRAGRAEAHLVLAFV